MWRSIRSTVLFRSCIFMVNMNLNKTILQSNMLCFRLFLLFAIVNQLTEASILLVLNFTKEIFQFVEHRSVKITDLLVLVFYADRIAMLFRISVAMSFLSIFFSLHFFITINTISTEKLNSIVMAQSLEAKQKTLRKTVFMSATAFSFS